MANIEKYYDKLMNDYYMVLINSWSDSVKEASRTAIKALSDLKPDQKADTKFLKSLEYVIRQQLGDEFANALDSKIKTFTELTYRVSAQENQFKNIKFSFSATDMKNIEQIKKQQVFWLREHYNGSVADRLSDILTQSVENKWTKLELSQELKTHFADIYKGSKPYFEGLAEHTSLRIREFARITNYQKCGATHYQIVAVMDERTSDICRALNGKIFPLKTAMETMNAMYEIAEYKDIEQAKERLKKLAPFVKESQIEYNAENIPIGVSGTHTPFPPFHWRCRTRTIMIYPQNTV
jgi:SPP1 gp7 family putative phage head morphogenesis protein